MFRQTDADTDAQKWLRDPFQALSQARVATAQGKQGIWKSIFPDRENTGNLLKNIKNMFLHREFTTNTGKILRVKKNNELVI